MYVQCIIVVSYFALLYNFVARKSKIIGPTSAYLHESCDKRFLETSCDSNWRIVRSIDSCI